MFHNYLFEGGLMKNLLKAKNLVLKNLEEHTAKKKWGNESIERNLQKSLLYLENAIEMMKMAEQKADYKER